MQLSEFTIGQDFYMGGRAFRCTDIGSRVVVGIPLEHEIGKAKLGDFPDGGMLRKLNAVEAEREGWLKGPPYSVAEHVFDEQEILDCALTPEEANEVSAA